MRILKTVLATLVSSLGVVIAAAGGIIYSGVYNVAATNAHWPITHWVLTQTVHRSIERQAANIAAPALGAEQQLLAGAANFEAMCSDCHAPPGQGPSVAARGMYPKPPGLAHAAHEKTASEIFWVIKHGIKASGMPAWGPTHSDDEIWAMTAFVTQLPDLSAADYRHMLASAQAHGIGHDHDHDSDAHKHGAQPQPDTHDYAEPPTTRHDDGDTPHDHAAHDTHAHS